MIKLRGQTGIEDPLNKIIFEPRPSFIKGRGAAPELEFPLIYGHRCPYCANVIQALFKAPRTFSLWPYEETTILSQGEKNSGEIREIYPDPKTRFGKSCYHMDFSPAEGGSIKLTLINHIMKHKVIAERTYDGKNIWDVGERPCTKTGVFALREDLLIKDWLLFSQITEHEVVKYNLPPLGDLIKADDTNFKLVPAVGVAPPVILVDRQSLVYGYHYQSRPMMLPYQKAGQ